MKQLLPLLLIALVLATTYFAVRSFALQKKLQKMSGELARKNEEVILCANNEGKLLSQITQPFSVEAFKIDSPLFQGKQITTKTIGYKGSTIIKSSLILPSTQGETTTAQVDVYTYDNVPEKDQVIFDDNEIKLNGYLLRPVLLTTPPAYTRFETKSGIPMTRDCGRLSFTKQRSSTNTVSVVISGGPCLGIQYGEDEQTIRASTKELERIAETMSTPWSPLESN